MAPSRRSSRTSRTSTRRMSTKSTKSVTFDLESEGELLTAIEAFVSASEFSSFSDFCKQAVQQYMSPTPEADSRNGHGELSPDWADPVSDSPELAQIQRQILALEQRLQAVTADQVRLDSLESEIAQLAQRLDQITDRAPDHVTDQGQGQSQAVAQQEEPEDPVLARLGSLLEDF